MQYLCGRRHYKTLHTELEEVVADFVGRPAAMVTGMGYVTNSAILPILIGNGGLIISDILNENSIVIGARGSTIRVFQHNRNKLLMGNLEHTDLGRRLLLLWRGFTASKESFASFLRLSLYAKITSIGAVGKTGRGVCELFGVDTADVFDIMLWLYSRI